MTETNRNPAPGKIDAGLVRTAITQARKSACQIDDLRAANSRTITALEAALDEAVKGAVNTPLTAVENSAAHRRAHRAGVLSRIESDPDLEAFTRAPIDTLTFAEIVKDVDAPFPPNRRTSVSAISRWWRANRDGQARLAPSANLELSQRGDDHGKSGSVTPPQGAGACEDARPAITLYRQNRAHPLSDTFRLSQEIAVKPSEIGHSDHVNTHLPQLWGGQAAAAFSQLPR